MKLFLPLLVILPVSLAQAPDALAGTQSLLDPYASVDAPTKSKKGHKADAVEESILDEASSSEPEKKKTPNHSQKAVKAPKEPKSAASKSSTNGAGLMTNVKSMEERSAEGLKKTGTKLVDGTKAAGSKLAEGTKTLEEHVAAGAKASGEYLKKGASAIGHGLQETTGKVKETASGLEHKIKPAPVAISAKPTDVKTTGKTVAAKTINGTAPIPTQIKSKDGYPGKPLDAVSDKPVKPHSGLLSGTFTKLNPFGHKQPETPLAKARPIDQSKAASLDFTPSASSTAKDAN